MRPNSDRPASDVVVLPPIDIYEDENGLVLIADLPGVSGETADVQMEESRLSIFGRLTGGLPDDAVVVHQEFALVDFLRSFILSDNIDHERIDASLEKGVLTIRLPRTERPAARRIAVRTKGEES